MDEVIASLYQDYMEWIDVEIELAKWGEMQWEGSNIEARRGAVYVLEAMRVAFKRSYRKACRTKISK